MFSVKASLMMWKVTSANFAQALQESTRFELEQTLAALKISHGDHGGRKLRIHAEILRREKEDRQAAREVAMPLNAAER